jgi:integrase
MPKTKINFTDSRLSKLAHDGSKKRLYFYDSGQPGLALQITPSGTKSFQVQVWDKTRRKSIVKSIDRYPAMSITRARRKAATLIDQIQDGKDIIEAAKALQKEPTFGEIFTRWMETAKRHKLSWENDQSQYDLYIKNVFANKKISWFTRAKIRDWHVGLTNKTRQRKNSQGKSVKISGITANRALALVSSIFNSELPDFPNPCKGVKKFREKSRDRFLQPDELKRFFTALEDNKTPDYFRDYIFLSLFTGARRSNVLSMKWNEIDFGNKTWRIPSYKSKGAEAMLIPLLDPAIQILNNRKVSATSVFVFPGRGRKGHIVEPKNAWKSLLDRAGLKDIRLHDLRRTLGSYQTITGASNTIVGKTLGHKSQQATAVYARLNLDPVRASMEKAVDLMMASKELPDKIVKMKSNKE